MYTLCELYSQGTKEAEQEMVELTAGELTLIDIRERNKRDEFVWSELVLVAEILFHTHWFSKVQNGLQSETYHTSLNPNMVEEVKSFLRRKGFRYTEFTRKRRLKPPTVFFEIQWV